MKGKNELIIGLLSCCITTPIWYFLLYQILKRVNATELMFFLFWVYVPASILATIITNIFEGK
jgi:hypothetical protein